MWVKQSRIRFEGWEERKCLQNAEKQLFDQPEVRELLEVWKFITHLFFCQSDEEVITMKLFVLYCLCEEATVLSTVIRMQSVPFSLQGFV